MATSSNLVLLCGYYGYGNGGDEALLATLIQMLPETVTPVVMTATPAKTANQHHVATCDRNNLLQVLPLMLRAKGFIWGGGSLIQDSTSWLSPLFYIAWMQLAQLLQLETIAWAQGVGPLNRSIIRAIARRTFQQCTARSTRDQGSAKLLEQWNVTYQLAPDPVWALTGTAPTVKTQAPARSNLFETSQITVAVVLRRHPLLTEVRLQCLAQALIEFQSQTQAHILFLPFQRSQDYDIAVQLQDQFPENSDLLMLEDPRQLKGLFQSIDMAIAMRLHALIMAASEGCRCFALSYDPKVTQLMNDLALPGYELTDLPHQSESITAHWQKTLTQPPSFDQSVIQNRIQASLAHKTLLHQVFSTLGVGG